MFFRVLLIIVIIYYLLKLIGRVFLPYFISHRIQKMEKNRQDAYRDYANRVKKEEGKVTVEGKPNVSRSQNSDKGEYIDFEEIK